MPTVFFLLSEQDDGTMGGPSLVYFTQRTAGDSSRAVQSPGSTERRCPTSRVGSRNTSREVRP